ncbi:hypothetical protein CTZ28_40295 [Streptomyces shenzhenensis]|uniref:Uncharacterized protein n=1 Tax=Streptomyces shenzhenensis TaxID=943815 RepID=A0A3M0I2Q3_9ACTN|nr:hypothetical protein CTZ28_40295 [Streptomyces shenzhenensis]
MRAELLRQMRVDLIEPPTAAQVNTIIRAKDCTRRLDVLVFTDPTGDDTDPGDIAAVDGDDTADEDDVESVLADMKAHPGNVTCGASTPPYGTCCWPRGCSSGSGGSSPCKRRSSS